MTIHFFGQNLDKWEAQRHIATGLDYLQQNPPLEDLYKVTGPKRAGLEPGFEGRKRWKNQDTTKLNRPGHPFHEMAISWLKTEAVANHPEKIDALSRALQKPHQTLARLLQECGLFKEAKRYIKSHFAKYQKSHYVKLTYSPVSSEPSRIPRPFEKMVIPSKSTCEKFGLWRGIFYYLQKSTTQLQLNVNAISEACANDAYIAGGCPSQKLRLLPVTNSVDGHLNFLLDGTQVTGPQGQTCHTFEGHMWEGCLARNQVYVDAKPYVFDEGELARMSWLMKLFGDWDKIGTTGSNLCFYVDQKTGKAHLVNIDPGKAFSFQMERRDDLNSDGTLQEPYFSFFKYRNVGLLEDTSLVVKLKEFAKLQKASGTILKTFDSYISYFSSKQFVDLFVKSASENRSPPLSSKELQLVQELARQEGKKYVEELVKKRDTLFLRYEYFQKVMQERLELLQVGDEAVAILEGLEKLTSKTSLSYRFVHLPIVEGQRVEWHAKLDKSSGLVTYSYKAGSAREARSLHRHIVSYLEQYAPHLVGSLLPPLGDTLQLTFDKSTLVQNSQKFDELLIADYLRQNQILEDRGWL